jgi:hypothetical protein
MPRLSKPLPESRFWNEKQAASRLGKSAAWFNSHFPHLRQHGFPNKDPLIGGFPKEAVERFIDNRSGIIRDDDPERGEEAIIARLQKKLDGLHGQA